MKPLARVLMLSAALACLIVQAPAQITITASDLTSIFAVGHSLANKIDKQTSTLDVGQHGSTTWDFSALRNDSSQTLTSVALSSAPFNSWFPTATHVFQTDVTVTIGASNLPAVAYIYFQLSGNVLNLGLGASITGTPATAKSWNIPADLFYALPSTYQTTWTSTYLDTTDVFLSGTFLLAEPSSRHDATYIVDAYGTMTLPGGSVHNALRIKKSDALSGSVGYIFLSNDGATVQATSANPGGTDVGTISVVPGSVSWNLNVLPLPIQLASLHAVQVSGGSGVLITWTTLSEINNYGFEVQRSAQPDAGFSTVPGGFVAGHGTTLEPQTYKYVDAGAPAGVLYYRLKQTDLDGTVHYTDPSAVTTSGIAGGADVPAAFSLEQNYPNPFNPATTIRYGLPVRTNVSLAVYNALGQRVATLVDGEQEAGIHEAKLDGSALASGVYFYRIQTPQFVRTLKLDLVK
ncbi:MAG TPA: T9SS type A sorting domain-containing protein [Bacteroidota bacterium]|nr:T9SS type A sorting domain-containing protein [Bacteroidota bacterium]